MFDGEFFLTFVKGVSSGVKTPILVN
jgi:hypothetical protein